MENMMYNEAAKFLEEAIKLELLIAELYDLFQTFYKQDSTFWWLLANEEKNHASLLRRSQHYFDTNEYPEELRYSSLDILQNAILKIKSNIENFQSKPPLREEAAQFALEIENDAYEIHYQLIMKKKSQSQVLQNIRLLNFADKDHAERIKEYFKIIS